MVQERLAGDLDVIVLQRIVNYPDRVRVHPQSVRQIFRDRMRVEPELAGEAVFLILAMAPDGSLRVKPQNLLVGLPIRSLESVS